MEKKKLPLSALNTRWARPNTPACSFRLMLLASCSGRTELSTKGGRELGFGDVGALWPEGFDMPPDHFTSDLERFWQQVGPFYLSRLAYVPPQWLKKIGRGIAPPTAPIPATCWE